MTDQPIQHEQNHRAELMSVSRPPEDHSLSDRHISFGWWSLLVFLTLGVALEVMHGLKIGWYLDVASETRRLTWTLAHAHGVLLAILHIVFGLMVRVTGSGRPVASSCLLASSFLLPGGFFLGGVFIHDGDPGLGILLVPVGALLLFVAVLQIARQCSAAPNNEIPGEGNAS